MGIIIGIRAGIGGGKRKPDKWLDPVSAEFTRRTSGGSLSVGSRAKIGSVKGRTLVWNQMVKNGNFASNSEISISKNSQSSISWSVSNNELTVDVVTQASTNDHIRLYTSENIIVGHKYYMSLGYTVDKTAYFEYAIHYYDGNYIRKTCSPGSGLIRGIITPSNVASIANGKYVSIYLGFPTLAQDNSVFKFRNAMVIDLTLMFGAGNEPSTADEFEALYNNPYYDFGEGALINNIASAIKTTGSEQQWENTLPINITTLTGKLSGQSSVVIFPDGMKSVGSVYDELTKTTATKRIGVVDAGELAWTYNSKNTRFYSQLPTAKMGGNILCLGYTSVSASAILSQDKTIAISGVAHSLMLNDTSFNGDAAALTAALAGTKIYYELDEPEVYTLDSPLSLSYRVDSFGTEERLPADTPSELSAPIRIEVSYTEPKPKDIKPVLSGPLLGCTDNGDSGNELNNIDYETDS